MIRLSAVIISLNEERNIGRCLESLSGVADEIVVVDSGSTDRTQEICKSYGVRFITNPFEGYIQQKNFALENCTNEHILSVDADESLSEDLKKSIVLLKSDWVKDGYQFNRLTNYCGKWIRHCGWYPDSKLRLFKKDAGKWGGSNPHDKFILNDGNISGFVKGDLLHYSYYTISDHIRQVNRFSEIEALTAYKEGRRCSLLHLIVKPKLKFIRDFIFRLGFLDGYYGLIICRISSYALFIRYAKLYELQKNKSI